MVIQVTFLTRSEPLQVWVSNARARPRKGNDAHVADAKQLSPSSSVSTMNFAKAFFRLTQGFLLKSRWLKHHVFPKSTLFSLQGEGDTVSEGKTNTSPLSGRWSGSLTSFYIFLAMQLQWKFLEIFWSIWFSKSSESMALTADPILVSLCFKEKEIEFRQKEHLSSYSGRISGKHHIVRKDHQSCNSDALTVKSYEEIKFWGNLPT